MLLYFLEQVPASQHPSHQASRPQQASQPQQASRPHQANLRQANPHPVLRPPAPASQVQLIETMSTG